MTTSRNLGADCVQPLAALRHHAAMRALLAVVVLLPAGALAADGGVSCRTAQDCEVAASRDACAAAKYGQGPVNVSGPVCACRDGRCALEQLEAVSCTSYRDCSLSSEPVLHPVSSKKVPRPHPRPVRPCVDDGRDSVCDPATRTCKVISWKC